MSKWREFQLEELAEVVNHQRIPLSSMERASRKGFFPYYGASGIVDYIDDYIFDGDYVLISEDGENLRTRKTPIAFRVTGKFWVNNHAHIIKPKTPYLSVLIPLIFKNLDLNEYITGAVQPKLNKANLLSIPIHLPESPIEQECISRTLSNFDDKIDLLHRQNKTLEAMGETLFRQWFVEDAQENWTDCSVSDFADHAKENIIPQNHTDTLFSHYSIPAFDNERRPTIEPGREILSNKFKVLPYSILVSKLNPRTPRIWPICELIINDSICSTEFQVIKPKNPELFGFVLFLLRSNEATDALIMAASGTSGSHQRVRPEDILNIGIKLPSETLAKKFSDLVMPNIAKMQSNLSQIQTLEKLRDTLLPKLFSGEVKVEI